MLRFLGIAAAAVLAAAAIFVAATLPPRAHRFATGTADGRLIWGAYHVHSTRSDGSGSVDDVARAAARAGLHFVILTDHGDATERPAAEYRHGVLCIEAVEVNTEGGHIVALNLRNASPYPIAGEASDVIEDIRRLGGWAVAAHPESPRPALRWRGQASDIDGFEWLNVDSEWRARGTSRLTAAALRALIRAPEALASLFESAPQSLARWDDRPGRARFSVAALDAHARIGADTDGESTSISLRYPGYESMFRTVAQAVSLEQPLTGDAERDAVAVQTAIGAGKSFSVIRGLADALTPVDFRLDNAEITATIVAVPDARLVLLRNGRPVADAQGKLRFDVSATPGRYRLHAFVEDRDFPWITTNTIDVPGESQPTDPAKPLPEPRGPGPSRAVPATDWVIEKDAASMGELTTSGDGALLRYRLGSGRPSGQYVAIAAPAGAEAIERIEFSARGGAPMRVSLQVRASNGGGERRWRKSLYVDTTPRAFTVSLAELQPVDRRSPLRPVVAKLHSVLLVIDTVNARPGTEGTLTISQVRLVEGSR